MQPPSPSRTRALLLALSLAVLGVWGCNLVESAQSDKVLAATVLATPAYDLKFLVPDASVPFDAGTLFKLPDGGLPTVLPPQTAAQVFFGTHNGNLTAQPTGIAGATVTLTFAGKSFTLVDQGDGAYGLTSQDDATFLYQEGAKYEISIASGGQTYTASVVGPVKEEIAQFKAVEGWPLPHEASTPLDLTRSNTDNVAFTTVIEVDKNTVLTDLRNIPSTYTDIPTEPLDLLDLIANDAPWRRKVISLPASAFPKTDTYYAVTVAAVQRGETSTNLFTASAFLVGRSDVGVVKTR